MVIISFSTIKSKSRKVGRGSNSWKCLRPIFSYSKCQTFAKFHVYVKANQFDWEIQCKCILWARDGLVVFFCVGDGGYVFLVCHLNMKDHMNFQFFVFGYVLYQLHHLIWSRYYVYNMHSIEIRKEKKIITLL